MPLFTPPTPTPPETNRAGRNAPLACCRFGRAFGLPHPRWFRAGWDDFACLGTVSIFSSGYCATSVPVPTPMYVCLAKVADLEEAVALRNEAVAAASRSPASPPPATAAAGIAHGAKDAPSTALPLWTRRGDTAGPDPALWTLASGHEAAGLAERLGSSWSSPLSTPLTGRGAVRESGGGGGDGGDGHAAATAACGGSSSARGGGGAEWCPRCVRLRTRLGKRCRKDLAAGRTGILIKATFNPLEGDSSTAKAR